MKVLVTGCAGFIGWKTCEFLLKYPKLIPSPLVATLKYESFKNDWCPCGGEGRGEGEQSTLRANEVSREARMSFPCKRVSKGS